MATYRVKFREGNKPDQVIDAQGLREAAESYVFFNDGGKDEVARIPREVVLSVVREEG